jgi:hypothetical protein
MTAKFQKRHYQIIATTMQEAHPGAALSKDNRAVVQWSETVKDFAEMLERDSSRFDVIRFVHACEPGANARS